MHYYMTDLIQFPSPHVHIEDYSHIMVGDEVMVVEIVVESMMMMKAMKSPSLTAYMGRQCEPKMQPIT
jgi:hypothetical protein